MRTFKTRRTVAHSAEDMFALVADVERYPEFVPLCEALKVRSRSEKDGREVLVADMTASYKMFRETFTSRVTLDPANLEILVEYLDGPFKHLENRWRFESLSEETSEIDFYLEYEFRRRSLQLLMGAMFDAAFSRFADAFEKRADVVYGRRAGGGGRRSRASAS
ncbi:type II toxin-antitoxin system RatA family toxin [Microbaculum marinum]|uniref:Type II toxin-antitoxin system RatA family toxin n=1 Tax=Microbaculum marinum TaxID=1764581 RepID=A0AAW9RS66_9HYPH